jgi:hypothetical protein
MDTMPGMTLSYRDVSDPSSKIGLTETGWGGAAVDCCVSTVGWGRGASPDIWHAIAARVKTIIAGINRFIMLYS